MAVHLAHNGVQFGQKPFVHDGQGLVVQCIFRCVKMINVRIQHKECISVPQGSHEFALSFLHGLSVEPVGQPGRAVDVEIPADRVRAVGLQRIKRIHRISFGLAHLLPVLILHMAENDDIFIRRFIKQQGGFRQQGIEPSAGLVHRLGDELRRELTLEQFFIFKRIMVLGKRHGSGIKPAVDHLRHPPHGPLTFRTGTGNLINVRTVQLHGPRIFPAA